MFVVRTVEDSADPICQLVCREQPIGLYHLSLAVYPLGLYGVQPRALDGQKAAYDPHSRASSFDITVVRSDPPPDLSAYVPGSVVPDQHPNSLAGRLELLRAPPKKAGRYGAYRAAVHEAQPHLGIELRQVEPITGNGLRIGIIFGDRLLDEAQGLARMAPAVKGRSLASRLNQVSSKKPTTHSGRPSARPINRSRRLFFFCTQGRERLSTVWPAPSAPPSSPKWPGWFRP